MVGLRLRSRTVKASIRIQRLSTLRTFQKADEKFLNQRLKAEPKDSARFVAVFFVENVSEGSFASLLIYQLSSSSP